MKATPEKLLAVFVFVILFLNVAATVFLLVSVENRVRAMGSANVAYGTVAFCLNQEPSLTIPCDTLLDQGDNVTCQLSGLDPEGQNLTYRQSGGPSFFIVNSSGYFNFTPDNSDVGEYSVVFFVDDGSGCSNSEVNDTYYFNITNINDPPYLDVPIPDIELIGNNSYSFFLNDHFRDPDGDALTYNHTTLTARIDLVLSANSNVLVRSSECGFEEYVLFAATDPGGLSADSNVVKLKFDCPETSQPASDSQEGAGAGGGGGGGASLLCDSEWECFDWLTCLPTGFQWRHCYDIHGCVSEPKFFKRECDYYGEQPTCEENWLCEEWSLCLPNGTQYRHCEDLNACGTSFYEPLLVQECVYNPSCYDGIWNGDETGVDCGGSCPSCEIIETPAFILEKRFNYWLLATLIIAALLVGGAGRLYHEELLKGVARLNLMLSRKKQKHILLSEAEKQELFEMLLSAEKGVFTHPEWESHEKYERATRVVRRFFEFALKLPAAFSQEEYLLAFKERKIDEELQKLLSGFFAKVYRLEEVQLQFDERYFLSITEELRTIIASVTHYTPVEMERTLKEYEITDEISLLQEALIRIIRTNRAIQFQQYELAKQEYSRLIKVYEDLPQQDQQHAYGEITRLFGELKYVYERREVFL